MSTAPSTLISLSAVSKVAANREPIKEPPLCSNSLDMESSDSSDTVFLCESSPDEAIQTQIEENASSPPQSVGNDPITEVVKESVPSTPRTDADLARHLIERLAICGFDPSPTSASTPNLETQPVPRLTPKPELASKANFKPGAATLDSRPRPDSCVFVGSLRSKLSDDDLAILLSDTFKAFGTVTRVKVLRDSKMCPYAFVQYETTEEALTAIRNLDGTVLSGRVVRCERASVNRTILVGAPPKAKQFNTDSVKLLCKSFGSLEGVVQGADRQPYWFVRFVYREDAVRAYITLRMEGDSPVEWVQNLPEESFYLRSSKVSTVSIGPLPPSVPEDVLQETFSQYGHIEELKLIPNSHGDPFAVIQYSTPTEAAIAVESACHTSFLGRTMRVWVLDPRKILSPHPAYPPARIPCKCAFDFSHAADRARQPAHQQPSRQQSAHGLPPRPQVASRQPYRPPHARGGEAANRQRWNRASPSDQFSKPSEKKPSKWWHGERR